MRLRQKLGLVFGALVCGVLALEVAVRVRHWLLHGSIGRVYAFDGHAASGLQIPERGLHGRIECDQHGFRSPELVSPKPEGTVRVAFLGGSTTFCAEASGNAATWPALVVEGLREAHPEQTFDWLNAAAAGYAVEHSIRNLRHRVAPHDPDVVVIYHGTNDLVKDTRALAAERGIWDAATDGEDWLEEHSMLWKVLKKNFLVHDRAGGPRQTETLEVDYGELVDGFAGRVEELVGLAKEVAPVVVLVTFSHRVRAEQDAEQRRDACQSALYYAPFLSPDGILEGIAAYNAAVRRVAEKTGAVLVAGEERIPADAEHFNDSVHLTDAGCRVQAARVVEALAASAELRALVESRAKRGERR